MAGENGILCKSFVAGADLSAKQYKFVELSDAETVVLAGDGEVAIGILQNNPALGEMANVMLIGISNLVVGATGIDTIMSKVASDASGDGDKATTDRDVYNAIALETGVDDDVIKVLLTPGQTISAT